MVPTLDTSTVNVEPSAPTRHPDVVEKVVESILEGLAFGLAPRNQQLVTDMLAMKMKLVNVETAAAAYRSFRAGALKNPYLKANVVANMLQVMALNDPRVVTLKASDLLDDRYVRRIEESGRPEALGGLHHRYQRRVD